MIRSKSTDSPHLVRYESVPDNFKYPAGPFHQAPQEFGGEWWFVNPFTGPSPWEKLTPVPTVELPPGFTDIFGARPSRKDERFKRLPDQALKTMQFRWDAELAGFRMAGAPELGLGEAPQLAEAEAICAEWNMGKPLYYDGRHGWRAAFIDSELPGWSVAFSTLLDTPGNVVGQYQIDMLASEIVPEKIHPWVPPHLNTPTE